MVDWIHDSGADIFYLLLGHPSGSVRDLLVSYDPADDRYERVRVFDAGVQVSQLASSNYDTFYVLATTANRLDPSEIPQNADAAIFDNWDSSRETEDTRILKYVVRTDRLTEFVAPDDAYPPQFGLHYMSGFENRRHIRWREGVYAESRSTFPSLQQSTLLPLCDVERIRRGPRNNWRRNVGVIVYRS